MPVASHPDARCCHTSPPASTRMPSAPKLPPTMAVPPSSGPSEALGPPTWYVLTPVPSAPEMSTATDALVDPRGVDRRHGTESDVEPVLDAESRRHVVGVPDHTGDVHARTERLDHREQHAGTVARDIHRDESRVGEIPVEIAG